MFDADLSDLRCSSCGGDGPTWIIENRPLCYHCAASGVVSQDVLETRARKAFVAKPRKHSESEFQSQVIDLLRLHGFKVAHFRPAMNAKGEWRTAVAADGAGFPDIVAISDGEFENDDGGYLGVAWELKAGKNKVTPEQEDWIRLFGKAGFLTGVYYPHQLEEMKNILGGWWLKHVEENTA